MGISIQKEIDLVNQIIRTAIIHGGDLGGAYCSDWEGLETSIGAWLKARGLSDSYAPANDVDGIVPLKNASFSEEDSNSYIWTLWISAVDINGKPISADRKWREICKDGLHSYRPGVKFQLHCIGKERFPFSYKKQLKEPGILLKIDVVQAACDGICKIYQDCIDGNIFIDGIPPQYITLCRDMITDINDILLWSRYEVFSTHPEWRSITLRNPTNGNHIYLYSDGNYKSTEALSTEMIDALVKVHSFCWSKS